jgi:hypothetical protein
MRRQSEPKAFDERLSAEWALLTAALENTGPRPPARLARTQAPTNRNRPSCQRLGLVDGRAVDIGLSHERQDVRVWQRTDWLD